MKPGRFLTIAFVVLALALGCMPAGAEEHQTYTVKAGDTLWDISQRFYGNRDLWPKLWEMNRYNVTNPHQLTIGDKLVMYPVDQLMAAQSPPAPPPLASKSLYDRGSPLNIEFPRYFTFVADTKGIGGTGVNRIKVKKIDPLTGKTIITYEEVRKVGEVLASMERGYKPEDNREYYHGKSMLSFNDEVVIRFTADLGKILDSATHEDPDPYFREFPIYGLREPVLGGDPNMPDFGDDVGMLHEFKGRITIVSRVETLNTMTEGQREELVSNKTLGNDAEPVSYIARITYSQLPITIGDKVFLFKSIYPGPDREIGARKLHQANQYTPTGP